MNTLFLYGSNLDPQRLQSRIQHWDGCFMRACLKGYTLHFNKHSDRYHATANITPDPTGFVLGILIELSDADLEILDRCLGYPSHYQRIWEYFQCEDHTLRGSWVYVAHPQQIIPDQIPSAEYLQHLLQGAKHYHFPLSYIENLYNPVPTSPKIQEVTPFELGVTHLITCRL